MEELVEEVLLRFPPADPALLVRAALVCKRWRRIVTGPGFRRRFRELHRAAPMLGFLCNAGPGARFVPTSAFRPPGPGLLRDWRALDARHGRALLRWDPARDPPRACCLLVWDPLADRRTELPPLAWAPHPYSWNAAVLCAEAADCDHLDCCRGGGHFLVVVAGTNRDAVFAYVYSSEAGAWSAPAFARHPDDNLDYAPSALVGSTLYFAFQMGTAVLEYDLGTWEMWVVRLPPAHNDWQRIVLAASGSGGLGFATADKSRIYLCSREVLPGGDAHWTRTRVIELDKLHPAGAISVFPEVVSFADGVGVIFLRTGDGLFTVDLKSSQVTKVSKDIGFSGIFPYMSFHTPGDGVRLNQ